MFDFRVSRSPVGNTTCAALVVGDIVYSVRFFCGEVSQSVTASMLSGSMIGPNPEYQDTSHTEWRRFSPYVATERRMIRFFKGKIQTVERRHV